MENSQKPSLIEGGAFEDERGKLEFVNNFNLTKAKRFYITTNNSTQLFRGWQGHKIEKRWFYCIKGVFEIKLIKIDNWKNPSDNLKIEEFILDEKTPQVLFIPNGYINGFRATVEESKLLIFSDYLLNEITDDEVRYHPEKWLKNKELE